MPEVREVFEEVSPITVEAGETSIKVGLSRRFFLFQFLSWLTRKIEDDPRLNFISILKSYKALGDIIDGTLHELYRDRNDIYFRSFFIDDKLYKIIKSDIEWVYKRFTADKDSIHITITKRGVIVYNNFKENQFNVLLLSIHSGTWMREDIQKKQAITKTERLLEEDIDTHKLYADMVLKKSGIWIDNKASRFACDYNRPRERAIYENGSEEWLDVVWKESLSKEQRKWLMEGYEQFYHTLKSIIKTHQFNIIFDGHSMKDGPDRTELSFGTKFIPQFYMPIVHQMEKKLRKHGYKAEQNKPFWGGNIIKVMNKQFPDRFVCSFEVNKKLYMTKDRKKVIEKKCDSVAKHLAEILDIEETL